MIKSKLATASILVALCFMLSYIEALIPFNLIIPGAKIGLSNIVVLYALYNLDTKYAFYINIIRICLSAMLFSTPITWIYSFAGGMLSFLSMILIKRVKFLSIISVSATGGIMHNLGQILVASLLFSNAKIVYYFPFLFVLGLVSGILNGYIGAILNERFKKI